MIYVIADIHGEYDKYRNLLKKINFMGADTLYVIGDAIDRGRQSVEILRDMMPRQNVIPLMGNHEYMALKVLPWLIKGAADVQGISGNKQLVRDITEWQNIGGQTTLDEFHRLSAQEQKQLIKYMSGFLPCKEFTVNRKKYMLVHAGITGFAAEKDIEDYDAEDFLFEKPDYSSVYYTDRILVTGHTPTRFIEENNGRDRIFRANNHIAIDCGCGFGGCLGAVCLDSGEEFYI